MARDLYDPYTMVVKETPELIEELTKLIMPMQPGGKPVSTVWGVLCDASKLHGEAMSIIEDDEYEPLDMMRLKAFGQQYASGVIIRKIADGMGVSNFKLREVPLERPEQPMLPGIPMVPMPDGNPGRDGRDPSPAT